ncbi:F-box domain-containing protein [Mycena indigotica]|uniref:F-box domain-containing protein n=1 Tax=Mycena indigotica TaxID=2126181 RepID=A0A8H6SRX8_9AGAR|nr:F-box domain-containing protein [Mycena indigotica]KAF7304118.1 F-box domain-containing protein [Mycena indigotica]
MKLSILTFVVASVGLAAASPMRVVIVSSPGTGGVEGVAELIRPLPAASMSLPRPHLPFRPMPIVEGGVVVTPMPFVEAQAKKPCGSHSAARLRQKAAQVIAAFKNAFHHAHQPEAAATVANGRTPGGDRLQVIHLDPVMATPTPIAGPVDESQFFDRLELALGRLGPWEGGLMAFVIGCGIGVLLRMFYILTLLAVRAIRAPCTKSTDDYYYGDVALEEDAEEIFVAPPMYTVAVPVVVDEKAEERK